MLYRHLTFALITTTVLAVAIGACDSDATVVTPPTGVGGNGAGTSDGGSGAGSFSGPTSGPGGENTSGFAVDPPDDQVISVTAGQNTPTLTYSSTFNANPVDAGWGVDRGEIGTVVEGPGETTTFTPSGNVGGIVKIFAGLNDEIIERRVFVELSATQNGPSTSAEEQAQIANTVGDLTAGGGIGGVGGEGLGVAVTDQATLTALDSPTSDGSGQGLTFLYPYDGTVWPRGLLAPLLQWDWATGDADAVKIELETTSGSFSYSGTFARPDILAQTGGNFIRHPVPQDAWTMATNSAGGTALDGTPDRLVLRLTVASGGEAYGPIEHTYTIAPARLAGTIYYQSYGTQLAKNFENAIGGDTFFGGAVLSIKVGDYAPQLAAGGDSPTTSPMDNSYCRVCHSVAADGSRLIAMTSHPSRGTYGYTITPGMITEETLVTDAEFPALTPDGDYALNPAGELLDLNNSGNTVAVTGLDTVTTDLGTPAFSPAGNKIVFNPMNGAGITSPERTIAVMDFDGTTNTFSNLVEVVDNTGQPAESRPGWPAFFPDGNSIVYQQQTFSGFESNSLGDLRTRRGAKAHLAWTLADGSGTPTPLDQANGVGYLPQLATPIIMTCDADDDEVGDIDTDHADDVNLNYEPTVNPVASGGYAWVVFTSRRMYGSVADIPPFCSDPRGVDLVQNITTKKLWVAAVDLNAPSGTDPSHPGFYLPAQELLAGNARAFWVLDPCRQDGEECETGDQCCNGFCSQTGAAGDPLECTPVPSGECSMTQEACDTTADCCDPNDTCINGFCAPNTPQ